MHSLIQVVRALMNTFSWYRNSFPHGVLLFLEPLIAFLRMNFQFLNHILFFSIFKFYSVLTIKSVLVRCGG